MSENVMDLCLKLQEKAKQLNQPTQELNWAKWLKEQILQGTTND